MSEILQRAERAVSMVRNMSPGPSRDRAMDLARGSVAILPNPDDRARLSL